MKLYIFRHGETYFSKNNLNYGDKIEVAEILPEGIPVIRKLATYLKNIKTDINFTSPYFRCIQTSGIVSEITGKKFSVDNNLRDWDPETETLERMIERMESFFSQLTSHNLPSASICTHGYPINGLIALSTKGFIAGEQDLKNFPKPGVLVTIENPSPGSQDKKVSFKDFNQSTL